ncbi:MAG TPA: toluene-4-monooxygenase system B family protein [Pseudonocardiaceae bacterium]
MPDSNMPDSSSTGTVQLGPEDQAPQLVPLNAVFANDFVQILVAVTTANTVREVAAAVAGHVEGKRVRALPYEKVVFHNGRRLSPDITVAEAGIAPLDHVRVEYDIPAGSPKEGMR